MEHTTTEVARVREAAIEAAETNIHELQDLQLVLIGGGIGDPVAA